MFRCVSVVVLFASLITLVPAAHAQMPQRWSGPYIGASIGHGSAQFDSTTTVGSAAAMSLSDSISDNSVFGGIQAGFNRRIGNFFVGLEADLQTADFSGSSKVNSPAFAYSASASIDWFGTARARAGFATDTALVYVTGGFAFGGVDYDALINTRGTSVHLSDETRLATR